MVATRGLCRGQSLVKSIYMLRNIDLKGKRENQKNEVLHTVVNPSEIDAIKVDLLKRILGTGESCRAAQRPIRLCSFLILFYVLWRT